MTVVGTRSISLQVQSFQEEEEEQNFSEEWVIVETRGSED
jgi:hypothetical protein